MNQFLPRSITARSEAGLRRQLAQIQAKRGAFMKIINIYERGGRIVCWFYDKPITEEDMSNAQ